jgi:LacI family transcriptional regulator
MATATNGTSGSTIYDVADHADVAISTVSRVLNDSPNVAVATRERVMASIRELQFRPDRTARSLAQRTNRTLAVAVPTFTTPFHNELLKGVRAQLDLSDVDLMLCDLDWEAPKETLMHFLSRGTLDGLLVAGLPMDEGMADELALLGAPVVLVGSSWPSIDSLYWEEERGARLAAQHLIDRGHERIGVVTTPHANRTRDARIRGYREALEAAGLPFDTSLIAYGKTKKHDGFSEEAGYEAMQDLLQLDTPVTAVFASSDVQAIGAWQALREAGGTVPDDCAIVGYDDIKVSRFIGLTSVAQNMHEVGEDATTLLLQRIAGKNDEPVSRLIHPELKVRPSSGSTG